MAGMSMIRSAKCLSRYAIVCLALIGVGTVFADTSKISPDLLPLLANPNANVNVIVQYSSPQTCSGGLLGSLLCPTVNLLGGVIHVVFSLLNAVSATVQAGDIVSISDQSNVTYISLDR